MNNDENFDAYKRIVRNARNRMAQFWKDDAVNRLSEFSDWDLLCAALELFGSETQKAISPEIKKLISGRCSVGLFHDEEVRHLGRVGLAGVTGRALVDFIDLLCVRLAELAESERRGTRVVGCYTFPDWLMRLACSLLKIQDGESLAEFSDGVGDFCSYACARNKTIHAVDIQLASSKAQCGCAELRRALGEIRAFVSGSGIKVVSGDVFDSLPEAPFSKIFIQPPFIAGSEHRELMHDKERRSKLLNDIRRVNKNLFLLKEIDRLTEERCADGIDTLMLLQVIRAKMLLREGGTLLALVPRIVVDKGLSAPLRRELVSRGWLKASVALPSGGLPGTCIDAYLLVISEGNERVVLVDAKHEVAHGYDVPDAVIEKISNAIDGGINDGEFSRVFSIQELLGVGKDRDKKEIPLSLSAVFDRERLSEFKGRRLGELCTITRGSNVPPRDRNGNPTSSKIPSEYAILDIKSMVRDGAWDVRLSAAEWEPKNYLANDYAKSAADARLKFVEEGDVLLPRLGTGRSFRPYLARGLKDGVRWVVGPNLICIRPDNAKVLPEFLELFLENDMFSKQLAAICGRCSGMMMISPTELGEVRIPDVNLVSQQSKVDALNKLKRDIVEYKNKMAQCEEKLKHCFDEF